MRIEIFVVKTELDKKQEDEEERIAKIDYECDYNFGTPLINELKQLEIIKSEITHEFGGLTIIPNCKGYWEDSTQFYKDNGEIWLIYTASKDCLAIIEAYAKRIKNLTYQKAQAFGIDGKLYLV